MRAQLVSFSPVPFRLRVCHGTRFCEGKRAILFLAVGRGEGWTSRERGEGEREKKEREKIEREKGEEEGVKKEKREEKEEREGKIEKDGEKEKKLKNAH